MNIPNKTITGLALLSGVTFNQCAEQQQVAERPNFLFILLDDQPFDAFQHTGRYPFLQLPNLNRLYEESVNFTNFFCTASICSPSRASFLTGTYPHVHGVNQNHEQVDPNWAAYPPYSSHLQKNGYQTAFVGKIHMAHLSGRNHIRPGFDYWLSFNGQGEYFNPELNENGREFVEQGYMTDILTDYAERWLRELRDPNKPFNLHLWHKAVHEPYTPADRHVNLYANDSLPFPPYNTHLETFSGKPEWQRIKAYDINWRSYEAIDSLPAKEWDHKNSRYMTLLKCISGVDDSVGRILAVLEELGLLENTVIIYSSDNGYFMGEHTYWDKRIAYENSIRIPMMVRYPALFPAGLQLPQLGLNVDMAPTILEMAGVKVPEYMQGKSLLPLLTGESDIPVRDAFIFQYFVDDVYPYAGPDMLAVRTDRYKFVESYREGDINELYDLEKDPGEMRNIINDPSYADILAQLQEQQKKLIKQYGYHRDRDFWLRKVVKN
jgi:N-acetylglucosamine-6-sulfatase